MSTINFRTITAFTGMAILSGFALPANAQDFFKAERQFLVEKECVATRSIRKRSDPVEVRVGKSYLARGLNKRSNPSHVFVKVGGKNKWLDLSCGRFADGSGPATGKGQYVASQQKNGAVKQCLPFFDEVDNPVRIGSGKVVDITPKPPVLNSFDKAVNNVCGAPGKHVSRSEFKQLLLGNPEVLKAVMKFTSGKVFAGRPAQTNENAYLDDLTEAWFKIKAFDHIICGEPSAGGSRQKIGGLHFHGRYLQLQRDGNACRMNNPEKSEVLEGAVYTMGVHMKNKNGRFVSDWRKGYGATLSAEDLLKVVTRAFSENPTRSSRSTGCLLDVKDDGKKFATVFVRRSSGIRTFYPDATPNGPGDRNNPGCRKKIDLQ